MGKQYCKFMDNNFQYKINKFYLNRTLLAISFTVFALIVSLDKSLFLSSTFARSKTDEKNVVRWENYAFFTFLIGYSFLLNVVGLLLSNAVSPLLGLLFFLVNILTASTYSFMKILDNKIKMKTRLLKDGFFLLLILLGGVLPSLGVY